jgi:hypothetical protein
LVTRKHNHSFYIKSGLYSSDFLEKLAMCVHLDLIKPSELMLLQKEVNPLNIEFHLTELIEANAPAYRARREQEKA